MVRRGMGRALGSTRGNRVDRQSIGVLSRLCSLIARRIECLQLFILATGGCVLEGVAIVVAVVHWPVSWGSALLIGIHINRLLASVCVRREGILGSRGLMGERG